MLRSISTWTLQTLTTAFLLLLLGLSGCGSSAEKRFPVSGRVTFDGKPLSAGVLRFRDSEAGVDRTADISSDGSYTTARGGGLPAGTYEVAVLPPRRDRPIYGPNGHVEKPDPPPSFPTIPAKYHQPATSGLTLTVTSGDNVFNVELQR